MKPRELVLDDVGWIKIDQVRDRWKSLESIEWSVLTFIYIKEFDRFLAYSVRLQKVHTDRLYLLWRII